MSKLGEISLKSLIILLACVMAMSPMAIDLYLPAMSVMSQAFSTTMPVMQNTLSVYLIGYASGLVIFGPLSDTLARRTMMLIGITGFALCSFALALSSSIEVFITLRFCQAFICSAALVVIPGTIREKFGKDTAKGLSYVSMVMMLAPMAAPAIGSVLLAMSGWRLIFFSLTGYAITLLVLVYRYLPEKAEPATSKKIEFLSRYKLVFTRKKARYDLASSMIVSLAFFGYLTAIPFVYLDVFHLNEFEFSLLFGTAVFGLMTAHFINSRLVGRHGSRAMLNGGLLVAIVFSSALLLTTLTTNSLTFFVISLIPLMGSLSIIAVNSDALILARFKHQMGTATAVIGVLRFGVGALAGPILAYFHNGTSTVFASLMFSCIVLIALLQLPMNLKIIKRQ